LNEQRRFCSTDGSTSVYAHPTDMAQQGILIKGLNSAADLEGVGKFKPLELMPYN